MKYKKVYKFAVRVQISHEIKPTDTIYCTVLPLEH